MWAFLSGILTAAQTLAATNVDSVLGNRTLYNRYSLFSSVDLQDFMETTSVSTFSFRLYFPLLM